MENLKKLSTAELDKLIAKHHEWFENGSSRATVYKNLDLSYVEFSDISFKNVEFDNVNFDYATFNNVDFSNVRLFNVSFCEASFYNCKFVSCYTDTQVSFKDSYFKDVDFTAADLESISFYYTHLNKVNFTDANCCDTDFRNAYITDCVFDNMRIDETTAGYIQACPEKGSFTAFKKASLHDDTDCIVELEVPADALRSSATTRKCRVSKAKVVSITTLDGKPINRNAYSRFFRSFIYKVGKTVGVKSFDKNRWKECASGIHCFMTRDEAVQYLY